MNKKEILKSTIVVFVLVLSIYNIKIIWANEKNKEFNVELIVNNEKQNSITKDNDTSLPGDGLFNGTPKSVAGSFTMGIHEIRRNKDGTATVKWNYTNLTSVELRIREQNFFGDVINHTGTAYRLRAGRNIPAFETTFRGDSVTWKVTISNDTFEITAFARDAV